jgi:hypothetical protein
MVKTHVLGSTDVQSRMRSKNGESRHVHVGYVTLALYSNTRHHNEFLLDFFAFAQRAFMPSEILFFAAAESLRLPCFGFNFPKGKDVAGPLVVLGLVPGRRPRRPFPTARPSRAAIA